MSALSRLSRMDLSRLSLVLLIGDVVKLRCCSVSTIRRRVRSRDFPVASLPSIDKKLRSSAAAVCDWIDACSALDASPARENAS